MDNPENTEFYLRLHRPGEALDVVQQVFPRQVDGAQSFNLTLLATIARHMRSNTGEHEGAVTLDIRKVSAQPDFSDGSRLQTFADGRIEVDLDERLVRIDNRPKVLSVPQFALISLLSSRLDHVWSHRALARRIWGNELTPKSDLGRVVNNLKRNLGPELKHAVAAHKPYGYLARSTLKK